MYLFSENSEEIPLSIGLNFYAIYRMYYNISTLYIVLFFQLLIVLFSTCIFKNF
uniref:Uncharacterized protein n=1 Tax=Siphoviridae sp. cttFh17 TaxID=2826491 RepID=A0A8S5NJL8_9CAUD|nr:MAG TPA: hypothetical protein [Siphoviridae sp. cttFh17]